MIVNKTQAGLVFLEPLYYEINRQLWRIIAAKSVNVKEACSFRDQPFTKAILSAGC